MLQVGANGIEEEKEEDNHRLIISMMTTSHDVIRSSYWRVY
jgi:hypothetical protein